MIFDYVIVGSGLTGAVIARDLVNSDQNVVVLERRAHKGGNVHDYTHPSGIIVHSYGPHYFRTNDDDLWAYVNQFSKFYEYRPILKSYIDGKHENWPILGSYIKEKIGLDWKPEFFGIPKNFEEASLAIMPRLIYEKFVKGYTEKQWGVSSKNLSPHLAKRFDVRLDDEPRLMRHKYQGIPENGYANFISNILQGIPTVLNFDFLKNKKVFHASKKIIYTGPIDEFYEYDLGHLKYRGQNRITEYYPDQDWVQPVGQINNPNPSLGQHIRTLEWKHMMNPVYAKNIKGTVITREITITPTNVDNYEYPFPDEENIRLYEKYRERTDLDPKLLICGRLGEYKYYDMDQAIARARMLARRLLAI